MKTLTLKKLFFITSIFVIFSMSAFAKINSEFILNVPIGASCSILSKEMKDYEMRSWLELDAGVSMQFGCMFQVKDGFGVSLLGEIGYSHDNYRFKYKENDFIDSCNFRFDSIQIGLLPKINIRGFSIGIGSGVKFTIYDSWDFKYKYDLSSISYSTETDAGDNNSDEWYDMVWTDNVDDNRIQKNLRIIPYIKLTFDYSVFFSDKWALNVGLFLGYDFLPKPSEIYAENTLIFYIDKPIIYGSFDFGVQLGLRFGPKA